MYIAYAHRIQVKIQDKLYWAETIKKLIGCLNKAKSTNVSTHSLNDVTVLISINWLTQFALDTEIKLN